MVAGRHMGRPLRVRGVVGAHLCAPDFEIPLS